ncbi:B-cell differentiation antigen CD72 [Diceros bicornis minor]|uniref:B-cell differentiation antigen CD72 n=1 Tax=Diceros bicornis minor TaxID=77932 RepID=UPI0026E93770|nr:B-cell differentiation antigen CD72 [Diceros bicornis minor]
MAEAITYADLRFVKAPLKKGIASRVGQDPEADEDGELTYENVQVPPVPGGSSSAPAGLGDKAGLQSQPPPAARSSVTSSAARRLLRADAPHSLPVTIVNLYSGTPSSATCGNSLPTQTAMPAPGRAAFRQYLVLGALLTCLLLGVASICLGVRYLQVSQQLQQMNRVLEATNSSLRQQLTQKMTQLGQREAALQGSRRELAQTQEALQVEQKVGLATKEQLQACQSDREKTKEDLQREEEERRNLEQRLSSMQDTLRPFFTCPSSDTCCPMGWVLNERSCFYVSVTQRSWEESRKHCKSLSSDLATFSDVSHPYFGYPSSLNKLLAQVGQLDSYWIGLSFNKYWQWIDGTRISGFDYRYYTESPKCAKLQSSWPKLQQEKCSSSLPCICEMEAFRYPDGDHSLH